MLRYFVVLTGFRGSGKSTVAEYLTDHLGFLRLSPDRYREMFFDKGTAAEVGEDSNNFMWRCLMQNRDSALMNGYNVVIECALSTSHELNKITSFEPLVLAQFAAEGINLERHFILLKCHRDEVIKRLLRIGKSISDVEMELRRKERNWRNLKLDKGVIKHEFENTTDEDYYYLIKELEGLFRERKVEAAQLGTQP